ncbi:SMI1/KNR4 family protein [Ralstonia pickettii]|nr:SMI1/KNR4 family protein [Ralstonia pickettii]
MDAIDKLIEKARGTGAEVWIAGPATTADIDEVERALQVGFPPSYREFLANYGAMSLGDNAVSGITDEGPLLGNGGGVHYDTLRLRAEAALPVQLVVVGVHEDGAYCLDTSRRMLGGECSVVNFQYRSNQHDVPIAADFHQWLLRFVFG